jgi:hypothetical protein
MNEFMMWVHEFASTCYILYHDVEITNLKNLTVLGEEVCSREQKVITVESRDFFTILQSSMLYVIVLDLNS